MKINWFKLDKKELIHLCRSIILFASPGVFSEFIIFLKIGEDCTDCDKIYFACHCNDCKNCRFKFCLCNFELEYKGNSYNLYDQEKKDNIRNYIKEWILKNLSKFEITDIIEVIEFNYYNNKDLDIVSNLQDIKHTINQLKKIIL